MKFTFKPFKGSNQGAAETSDGEPVNPKQKRKEQIRRAQKTHRERKEAYVKSLEAEIVEMRNRETAHIKTKTELYQEIQKLRSYVQGYGIELPERRGWSPDPTISKTDDTFTFSIVQPKTKLDTARIKAKRRGQSQSSSGATSFPSSGPSEGSQSDHERTIPFRPQHSRSQSLSESEQASVRRHRRKMTVTGHTQRVSAKCGGLDLTSAGIEFVLMLEAPCLDHVRSEIHEHGTPTSHALTISASLLDIEPGRSPLPGTAFSSPPAANSPPQWEVPAGGIQKLLELSQRIPLEDDLTPVQIWDYLSRQEQFAELEVSRMEMLVQKLVQYVACHGFGAAIPEQLVKEAIAAAFTPGLTFWNHMNK